MHYGYYGHKNNNLGLVIDKTQFSTTTLENNLAEAQRKNDEVTKRINDLRLLIFNLEAKSRSKIEEATLGLYRNEIAKLTNQAERVENRWRWIGVYARKRTEATTCISKGNNYDVKTEQCSVYTNSGNVNTNYPTYVPPTTGSNTNTGKGGTGTSITSLPTPVTTTSTGTSSGGFPVTLPTTTTVADSKAQPPVPPTNEQGNTSPMMSFYEKNKTGILITGGVVAVAAIGGGIWYANKKKKKGGKKNESK